MNIVSAQFKANPFPVLARLRSEEPIHRTTLPDKAKTPVWLVTRYEDVNALLKDERFPKNRRSALTPEQIRKLPWVPPMFRPLERNMLDLDGHDHTRLRALVHKGFTPRLVERMRTRVQTLADELLEGVARRGEMDLINDYALPLPMTIITEILGVPTGDQHKFHKWSKRSWRFRRLIPRSESSPRSGCLFVTCAASSKCGDETRATIWRAHLFRRKRPATS